MTFRAPLETAGQMIKKSGTGASRASCARILIPHPTQKECDAVDSVFGISST